VEASENDVTTVRALGLLSTITWYPLDFLKTNMMLTRKGDFKSPTQIFREGHTQGLQGIYSGLVPAVLSSVVQGTVKVRLMRLLASLLSREEEEHPEKHQKARLPVPALIETVAFGLSGVIVSLIMCPIELIKVILQSDTKHVYGNSWDVVTSVHARAGVTGLFTGLFPYLLESLIYSASLWSLYRTIISIPKQRSTKQSTNLYTVEERQESIWISLISLFLTGVGASLITTPFTLVRTRFQVDVITGEHAGLVSVTKNVFQNYGLKGFFLGAVPKCLMAGLTGVQSLVLLKLISYFWR